MTLARRHLLFGGYALALAAVSVPALRALTSLALRDETASHLILIPFVTAFLIFQERHRIFAVTRTSAAPAAALIAAGLAVAVAGSRYVPAPPVDDSLSFYIGSFVLLCLGGFMLAFGAAAFRRALFPLLFLGFMTPIPSALLAAAVQFLKVGSTEMVAWLFSLTGTPYYR